jgi:hypothetical protein
MYPWKFSSFRIVPKLLGESQDEKSFAARIGRQHTVL